MFIHVDDILVMRNHEHSHKINIDLIFNKLKESGIILTESKCFLGKEEVKFLGFKVGKYGIKAGPKIQGIEDFPSPKDIKGVRSFLGMVNQYAICSPNIAQLSRGLRELLHKDIPWL